MNKEKEVNKQENAQPKQKRIMIATPCHDRKLPVEYVAALLDTMRAGIPAVIAPVFLPGEAMLPHARNYLASLFLESSFDVLFFIDSDMAWAPEQFAKIALSDKPVMSGVAHLKAENAPLNFREISGQKPDENGILSVESIGCAFIKLDRAVVEAAARDSAKYKMHDETFPAIFEYGMDKGEFVGEDITFCRKIKRRKYKILADLGVVIGHIGSKIY